tara:strand:- start:7833 stop:8489 length:657 start_codon:yes stop_codon:yes gene_type:complete
METKIKIGNLIAETEKITKQIEYLNQIVSFNNDNLKSLVSLYRQENNDEESLHSLTRYLYWYSNMPTSDIGDLTGISYQKVRYVAGSIVKESVCLQCRDVFTSKFFSRRSYENTLCPKCTSQTAKQNNDVFLEDWMGTSELSKHFSNKTDYHKYLRSPHWENVRRQALKISGWKCQACSQRNEILDVHHNNYDCLYNETSKDVVVLCRTCHNKIHKKK